MERRAKYSPHQKLLVWWRSPNACVYQRGVKTWSEAQSIVADSGIEQHLQLVDFITMPNWQ